MFTFILQNMGNILVGGVIVLSITLVSMQMLKSKKQGKSCGGCGSNCGSCPHK